jgi:hypothetical protein
MNLTRSIEPELLDSMKPNDPRAIRARHDLQRVNILMGHLSIWRRILHQVISPEQLPMNIVELGTGDGTLMLRLAYSLTTHWPNVKLYLVDRHPAINDKTLSNFATVGWQTEVVEADVMDWTVAMPRVDLIVANLFLHHLTDPELIELFRNITGKTTVFAACEPRRSSLALLGSHLLVLAACGPVTRYDAVVSVRAGFSGDELSALWPEKDYWQLYENKAGLFTHTFLAQHSPTSAQSAQP